MLPEGVERAPEANTEEVSVSENPSRLFAALRFSGSFEATRIAEKQQKLLAQLSGLGIETQGSVFAAGYDPPWTIPALRGNEVLVGVDASEEKLHAVCREIAEKN